MLAYKAPLDDIRFVLYELLSIEKHYQNLGIHEPPNQELMDAILQEGSKFAERQLAPLNQSGDLEGCHFNQGEVTTPKGFKEAYQQFKQAGWGSISATLDFGGQGLPSSLGFVINELFASANLAWSMYPGLTQAAINAIHHHGSAEQRQLYLPRLITGEWSGTMCLTESHCGSDLGLIRTKAEPTQTNAYHITGSKIFISAGEHDLTNNIIHLVLARLPGAPAGTKGISLFIVPKYKVDKQGNLTTKNPVNCTAIEHKMGINGSATCALSFEQAEGYLVGEAHKGLKYMFTMMNEARLGTGMQGLSLSETAWQQAFNYARERLQMRSLNGPKYPDQEADPIIVHPDVKRMLLTQRAFTEGGRALAYYIATLVDITRQTANPAERQQADDLLSLLTPIAKAFLTEIGFESANLGLQIFGGHGYIKDWGVEQLVRDARIPLIYEGTNGIQALDLLGRKVLMTRGQLLKNFTDQVDHFCQSYRTHKKLTEFIQPLNQLNREWPDLTLKIGMNAMKNREEVGAAAFDYLMYSGYIVLAYFWAKMALVAHKKLATDCQQPEFYQAKLATARFYFKRILPRTKALAVTMQAGADSLMGLD